ncbi:hypothetical protein [Jannaschia pohangensis]|uniref:Uncharacterized protein n=1 Tax=Jannaschia pohangensis TaxID=390807 RepID=A0A1I3HYA2_9RHOB|nr:hypothetical protein [Jannaschia pohangensis]SFI40622.1 hypothetical protein SAMN04488095_0746 [Jannaschia pohangensis]
MTGWRLALALAAALRATALQAQETLLTLTLSGDLWRQGGVVRLFALPTPAADIPDTIPPTATVTDRYSEVQLRFPETGTYRFRFAAPAEASQSAATELMSVMGGATPMTQGFTGQIPDGGLVVRVLPLAEHAGDSADSRQQAAWGIVEGYDAKPPADARSARVLAALMYERPWRDVGLSCSGTGRVQVCAMPAAFADDLDAAWWRDIARARLDRMRDRAVAACYDSGWSVARCEAVPDTDEPTYRPAD